MIQDARAVAKALSAALAVDEYVVSELRASAASISLDKLRSTESAHVLTGTLYVDRKQGRGTAAFSARHGESISDRIKEASTRAFGALGPAWTLPPPSAPSRVTVRDVDDPAAPAEIAEHVLSEFSRSLGTTTRALSATASAELSAHRAIVSTGFDGQYSSANIELRAMLEFKNGAPVPLALSIRRLADLNDVLDRELARARERSVDASDARPLSSGMFDIALELSAYTPVADYDFGIWTPLVDQANAERVRAGISSHALGQPLLVEPTTGDALSISSVGNLDYALRCAPFSKDGQAVRGFPIVTRGVATGYSVNHRDSALGAGIANGGVRRLQIAGGKESSEELGRPRVRPLLLVKAVDSLTQTRAGGLLLEIASGELRQRDALGTMRSTPIRGGIVAGQLRDWLPRMRLSSETTDTSWMHGPRRLRVDRILIH